MTLTVLKKFDVKSPETYFRVLNSICKNTDMRFLETITENTSLYRFGALIYNGGNLEGLIKTKLSDFFTPFNSNSNFEKYKIYDLYDKFYCDTLKNINFEKNTDWLRINIIGDLVFYHDNQRELFKYDQFAKNQFVNLMDKLYLENKNVDKFDIEVSYSDIYDDFYQSF